MLFGKRKSNGSPPVSPVKTPQSALEEAEAQYLGKQSKLRTATDAVFLKHLSQIAEDDVQDVRNLKAKHLKGPWENSRRGKGEEDMGDIIIADDVHYGQSGGSTAGDQKNQPDNNGSILRGAVLAAGLMLGGTLTAGGIYALLKPQANATTITIPQAQPQAPLTDRDYKIRFFDKDGKEIRVPHITEKPIP